MTPERPITGAPTKTALDLQGLTRLHLRVGWWFLLKMLSLGITLETLHGAKAGVYLDLSNQTRRQMWTLAHAHGTLLSVPNLVFEASIQLLPRVERCRRQGARVTASPRGTCGHAPRVLSRWRLH